MGLVAFSCTSMVFRRGEKGERHTKVPQNGVFFILLRNTTIKVLGGIHIHQCFQKGAHWAGTPSRRGGVTIKITEMFVLEYYFNPLPIPLASKQATTSTSQPRSGADFVSGSGPALNSGVGFPLWCSSQILVLGPESRAGGSAPTKPRGGGG